MAPSLRLCEKWVSLFRRRFSPRRKDAKAAKEKRPLLWTYGGSNTNDEWAIESLGGGFFRIINRNSGKVLEVAGSSTTNGADVAQRTWNGGANQQFQIISVP
jgi:hypothetical protein